MQQMYAECTNYWEAEDGPQAAPCAGQPAINMGPTSQRRKYSETVLRRNKDGVPIEVVRNFHSAGPKPMGKAVNVNPGQPRFMPLPKAYHES